MSYLTGRLKLRGLEAEVEKMGHHKANTGVSKNQR